jgi:hypothetical protein
VTLTSSLPPSHKRRARVDEKDIIEECQSDTQNKSFSSMHPFILSHVLFSYMYVL